MNNLSQKQDVISKSLFFPIKHLKQSQFECKNFFITGSTGFFGIWLLSAFDLLRKKGSSFNVCVLSRNPKQFLKKYPRFANSDWLSFITGDIKSFKFPEKKFDFIIHGASETSLKAHSNPISMFENIYLGTRNLMNMGRICAAKRILYISSGAVYGHNIEQDNVPFSDSSLIACDPLKIENSYGEGKRVMELLGGILHKEANIENVVARCFTFCGPGFDLNSHYAFNNFLRDALFEESLRINGTGKDIRSYLYGADLAVWLLKLLMDGKTGEAYNVGSEKPISIENLAIKIRDLLSPDKNIVYSSNQKFSIMPEKSYFPKTANAQSIGCFEWTNIDEAIIFTAEHLRYIAEDKNKQKSI